MCVDHICPVRKTPGCGFRDKTVLHIDNPCQLLTSARSSGTSWDSTLLVGTEAGEL